MQAISGEMDAKRMFWTSEVRLCTLYVLSITLRDWDVGECGKGDCGKASETCWGYGTDI